MKLKDFKSIRKSDFINNYELTYINKAGNDKVYEMVSRETYTDVSEIGKRVAGVTIAAFNGDRILLSREFRMGVNSYIYSFPSGLIDGDETPEEAAARELMEETNMVLTNIKTVLKPSFSCTGITDEKTIIIFCEAVGETCECKFDDEEICSSLYTKEEVRELLENETFSARAQAVCYLWSKE